MWFFPTGEGVGGWLIVPSSGRLTDCSPRGNAEISTAEAVMGYGGATAHKVILFPLIRKGCRVTHATHGQLKDPALQACCSTIPFTLHSQGSVEHSFVETCQHHI